MDLDLDKVLDHLRTGSHLDEKCVVMLIQKFMEVIYEEPTLVRLTAPITICGDIHGQLFDLFELFKTGGDPATTKYLFMGDYVDRGRFSLETLLYLVALKLKYPNNFTLLRGNHECRQVSKQYGFYNECFANYGHAGIWNLCQEAFDILPLCALIDERVFSTHGGLSPDITLVDQVSLLNRQVELPLAGPLADLTWSDPDDVPGWQINARGAGFLFGSRATLEFCHNNHLDLITRAHQLVHEGYQYKFSEKLITVWSAPNYTYVAHNKASVLILDEHHNRSLPIFYEAPPDDQRMPVDYIPHYFT